MFTSTVPVFAFSVLLSVLISGSLAFTVTTPPTVLQSGPAATGAPSTVHGTVTQQGAPPSESPGTFHTGQQTSRGSAPWRRIVGGRYHGMYTNDMPVSRTAAGHPQTYTNGQPMTNTYAGASSALGQRSTPTNGQRVSYTNGILNRVPPYQGHTGNVRLVPYPSGQHVTSPTAYQQYLQLLRNAFPSLYSSQLQGVRYPATQIGVRTNTPTRQVGRYTNTQSQPAWASHQSTLPRSSVTRLSAPVASPPANTQAGTTQPRTPTGRNTHVQQTRTQAAASVRTTTLPPTPAGSATTATPPTTSKSYNATRVATLLKALMAPAASLLPYAVVDPIPYGAAKPEGQQTPLELVGPSQHPVPPPANTLTKLGRAMLSGPVQSTSPLAIPPTAPAMPVDDPIYTPLGGIGVNMIDDPHKPVFDPLGLIPVKQPNTINPNSLALLASLPALQPKQNIVLKLADAATSISAAKSLDCKTVASLKGHKGNSYDSMSCDDDVCPGSMSCMMVYHVAFCCPQGVTYSMIQREAKGSMMNIIYDS